MDQSNKLNTKNKKQKPNLSMRVDNWITWNCFTPFKFPHTKKNTWAGVKHPISQRNRICYTLYRAQNGFECEKICRNYMFVLWAVPHAKLPVSVLAAVADFSIRFFIMQSTIALCAYIRMHVTAHVRSLILLFYGQPTFKCEAVARLYIYIKFTLLTVAESQFCWVANFYAVQKWACEVAMAMSSIHTNHIRGGRFKSNLAQSNQLGSSLVAKSGIYPIWKDFCVRVRKTRISKWDFDCGRLRLGACEHVSHQISISCEKALQKAFTFCKYQSIGALSLYLALHKAFNLERTPISLALQIIFHCESSSNARARIERKDASDISARFNNAKERDTHD